ncbi:MAG: bifunctional glutamate N-acetyltransferase/amino-acid acetyltransferase ArgJ [Nitrospina sp.]|nr:bifunctional glutamate N-acetyltransferase/amino-acid acetyltransferase ArgJ [Nitrospina sp.]
MKLKNSKSVQVPGFKAGGIACGIKKNGTKDLTLIVSDTPAACAGVFTLNEVRAPSVVLSEKMVKSGKPIRAVVVNSGNANACTGKAGADNCHTVLKETSLQLGVRDEEVLMASTGVIGVPLPVEKITRGIPHLARHVSASRWSYAAEGILTTDLVAKMKSVEFTCAGKKIVIGGIAKGSGMIAPNMATMLGFLATNARVSAKVLQEALEIAVGDTFNRITVDGECSTNDMVLLMANGKAGNDEIKPGSKAFQEFLEALTVVCRDLAFMIVKDGEGATRFVTIQVRGAKSRNDAEVLGKRVANSMLVKTALFGADPNWGRIMGALGDAGVAIKPEKVDIAFNGMTIVQDGSPLEDISLAKLRKKMKCREVEITIDLNLGKAQCPTYTCDLSYDYVRINAEYTT